MKRDVRINVNATVAPRAVGPPLLPPMAMTISRAEQDHQAAMRVRSYELALARGHVRR